MAMNLMTPMTNHPKTMSLEKGSSRSCLTLLPEYAPCTSPAPNQGPKKVKVQEPDIFDGADPHKLRDVLVSCNVHFRDCPHVFSSDEKKILFMLSYLKGAAINLFEPGLMDPTNSAHWMWDFSAFINELESNFGSHDSVGDAKKALTELTMREHSCIVKYNVDFWKLAYKLNWNESTHCTHYFCRLPLRLRTEFFMEVNLPPLQPCI